MTAPTALLNLQTRLSDEKTSIHVALAERAGKKLGNTGLSCEITKTSYEVGLGFRMAPESEDEPGFLAYALFPPRAENAEGWRLESYLEADE